MKAAYRHSLHRGAGLGALIAGAVLLGACSQGMKEWAPEKKTPKVYTVAFRQVPPEPAYNRMRWVHLPEVLPSRNLPDTDPGAPQVMPVYHMKLSNATVEKFSQMLAKAASYQSYCASSIAKRTLSINKLGTVDELAQEVAEKAQVTVLVDHQNRRLSFLAKTQAAGAPAEPRFVHEAGS